MGLVSILLSLLVLQQLLQLMPESSLVITTILLPASIVLSLMIGSLVWLLHRSVKTRRKARTDNLNVAK